MNDVGSIDQHASNSILVLAAVIERHGRYLVCKRPTHKRHGGLWEFPGGKLEANETRLGAARRELAEELGVTAVSVGMPLLCIADPDSPFVIEFTPTVIAGEPVCLEHTEHRWTAPQDLPSLPLAPSDRTFVDYLLGKPSERPRQP